MQRQAILRNTSSEHWILGACFLISGATSLVLEVAWSKQLSYILGSTLYASATVVAAFMAGLGIGGALAGRFAARFTRPGRCYALIQFGIAICGAVSIPVFHAMEPAFRYIFQTFEPAQAAFLLARFAAVFLLIAVPATLMGMTLPIVIGAYTRQKETYGFEAGLLYGVNTLGAMCGTWLAGFFLLPAFGLEKTCLLVALSDAVAGAVALWIDLRLGPVEDLHRSAVPPPWLPKQWVVGSLFTVSGAAAMAYEVAWFRLLGLTMGPSVYVLSAILGVFLLGVGFGSTAAARWAERTSLSGTAGMAALEGLLCLVGLGSMFYYNQLPRLNYDLFIKATGAFGSKGLFLGHITMAALVVLAPCLLMGALFPVTVRAVREFGPAASAPEANVCRLYVMNTFGGILGSLAAGFLMVPQIGVWKTLLAAALVSGVLALGALSLASQFPRIVQAAWAAALLAAVAGLAAAAPPLDVALINQGLYRETYTMRKLDLDRTRQEQLVYFSEGINTSVAVFNGGGEATLRVGGKADASTVPGDFTTQLFVGHLPVMFAENPKRAAVIGYGSGMSAMAVLTHPEVELLDILEIERGVIGAAPYFDCISLNPLGDPRTRVVLDDARVYLTHTRNTYDVITSEPSNPWMAGMSNLFTTDFYRIVRERLSPNGLFGQWIQTYELSDESFKVILASIQDVFPHIVIFRPAVGDVVVVASASPIRLPWAAFQKRFLEDKALASFQRVDLTDPLQLFFHFYASEDAVRKFIASTRSRNTDDNVWLEYHTPGNIVETSSLDTAQEHGIGIGLLEAGADQRLDGFETMLPGVPIEALLKESLAYQYGLRLGYDRTGAVIDRWGAARKVVVEGLRSAVRRRDDTELSTVLERGVSQGETKIRTRSDTPSDIAIAEASAAASFYKKGDLQNAEAHYRNVLRYVASPAYYEALVGLGNVAVQQGRREQAQEFYERAVARNPYRVIAFHNLASLFLGTDAAKLRSVVERGLRFNPQDSLLAQFR